MVLRLVVLTVLLGVVESPAQAFEHLEWPGGTEAIRRVTNLPGHVTDDMLLVEVARTWYGVANPLSPPSGLPARLLEQVKTSTEPAGRGPILPLSTALWSSLLRANDSRALAAALVGRRDAMLLYHGLMGMEDSAIRWIADRRDLLEDLLGRRAAPFASAAPAIRIENGVVAVPGGAAASQAWERVVDAPPDRPDEFIRKLMDRREGRIAWMFSVLSSLTPAQLRFAIGPSGEQLEALSRRFASASPEWDLFERPFWRPAFGPSIPLLLVEPDSEGAVHGSEAFWRQVLGNSSCEWVETASTPLTGPVLLDLLVGTEPHRARDRWMLFAYGQRLLAKVPASRDVGLALRESEPFPALRVSLERTGTTDPALQLALYRAAARLSSRGGRSSDHLAAWQGAAAVVEQATLRGGLSAAEAASAYGELAAMPMNDPATEVTRWLLEDFVSRLLARPGIPPAPELALLRAVAGELTPAGPRVPPRFRWEDLDYAFVPQRVISRKTQVVRDAQGSPSLDDAVAAWRVGNREARRKAVEIVRRVLPAVAYAPHQAATDAPALGADIPFRHEFAPFDEGPAGYRRRPWMVPRGNAHGEIGWHLEGSLLGLDLALHHWYVHRHGEPPPLAPTLDEPDLETLELAIVLAQTTDIVDLGLSAALAALDGAVAATARMDPESLDAALAACGVDGWRRRAIRLAGDEGVGLLTLDELWRLGGSPGRLVPRWPLDGCACLGAAPRVPVAFEGRRSAGLMGALSPGLSLRIARYLDAQRLPAELFPALLASAVVDVIHGAQGARPDDRLALERAAQAISDVRLEEHLLALVSTGAMGRP